MKPLRSQPASVPPWPLAALAGCGTGRPADPVRPPRRQRPIGARPGSRRAPRRGASGKLKPMPLRTSR
jgi:hypothetical protein